MRRESAGSRGRPRTFHFPVGIVLYSPLLEIPLPTAAHGSPALHRAAAGIAACTLLLAGCVQPETERPHYDDSDDQPDDTGAVTEAPAPDGCTEGDGPATNVTASLTDIPTVVRVSWDADATGYVSFTTSTGAVSTPTSGPGHHEALLVGNRAVSPVAYRVVSSDTGTVWCGTSASITTGALDPALPPLYLATDPALAGAPLYTVVPIFDTEHTWLTILDPEGAYVWAWLDDLTPDWPNPQVFRAALDSTFDGVLGNHEATAIGQEGGIVKLGYDGTLTAAAKADGVHTDFAPLGDGGYGMLGWEIQEIDGRKFLGDTIEEVDATGASHTVWSAFDWFTPDLSVSYPTGFYHADASVEDWTHANGIDYDADEGAYFVSIPGNGSIARVDRASGAMTWWLSDTGGDFTNAGSETMVTMPHSVEHLGNSVLVFNRGPLDDPQFCSYAAEIAYDEAQGTADTRWSYTSPDCLHVSFLGEARRAADGSTLIVWSSSGRIDRVSPTGDVTWQLDLHLGAGFGFADFYDSLYPAP